MAGSSAMRATASERLAAHALAARAEAMPPAARAAVAAFTLDTVGVGLGGAGSRYGAAVLGAAAGWGQGREAGAWGSSVRLPVAHAAFVNAFQVHCQEYDCVLEAAVLHPFTVVAPVLLAEAEARGMSGRDYVAACAAGVDVAGGLGIAARTPIRFFRPATCGLFGATAALSRARGLSLDQSVHALGYALAFASGTMQAHVEGTPALAVQTANAARAAFHAVDLAEAGLPGPRGAIDGPFGYLSLFEQESALAPVLEALGAVWRVEAVSWKPYPTGRAAHGGVAMMLALRAEGLEGAEVERIVFHVPPLIAHLVGRPIAAPLEVNYARLCLAYAAAAALLRGGLGLGDFTPEALSDPETHALAQRVTIRVAPNPDPAAFTPQSVEVLLKDGATRHAAIEALPGSPAKPLSRAAQIEKFRACVAFGLGRPDPDREDALIAAIDDLERLEDVGQIARLAGAGA